MKFSERIKQIRDDNEYSREDLAKVLSVKPKEIEAWEEGKLFPQPDVLRKISDQFKFTFDELFTAEDIIAERVWQEKAARRMSAFSLGFLFAAILLTVACYYYQIPVFGYLAGASGIAYLVFAIFSQPLYKRISKRSSFVVFIVSRSLVLVILLMVLVIMIRWQIR